MSLRLRLIVAFFCLSVVPLAAVTLFTYASNARAMREAAGPRGGAARGRAQPADAGRHGAVERARRAADGRRRGARRSERRGQRQRPADAGARPRRPIDGPRRPAPPTQETQVAQALGEMAMLLENIELRGLRPPRPGGGGPPGRFGGRRPWRADGSRGGASALPAPPSAPVPQLRLRGSPHRCIALGPLPAEPSAAPRPPPGVRARPSASRRRRAQATSATTDSASATRTPAVFVRRLLPVPTAARRSPAAARRRGRRRSRTPRRATAS